MNSFTPARNAAVTLRTMSSGNEFLLVLVGLMALPSAAAPQQLVHEPDAESKRLAFEKALAELKETEGV